MTTAPYRAISPSVDRHGVEDVSPPQYILNVSDLGQILKAFAGDAWTDDPGNMHPGECP